MSRGRYKLCCATRWRLVHTAPSLTSYHLNRTRPSGAALSLSSPSPPSTILTTRSGSRGCSRWSVALCLGANRCRTYVVLVTNENDVDATKRIMSQAALGEQVEVMAPHANTAGEDAQLSSSHPMMLAFGHRSVMRAALSQYDLFVYLEADMLMLLPQLQAWARDEAALLRDPTARANGVHRGFYRWEVHNGSPIMSDEYPPWLPRACSVPDVASYPCRYNVLAPAPHQGSRWFIGLPNPYSAAWVMRATGCGPSLPVRRQAPMLPKHSAPSGRRSRQVTSRATGLKPGLATPRSS